MDDRRDISCTEQQRGLDLRPLVRADRPALCRLLEAYALPVAGLSESLHGFVGAGAEGRPVGAAGVEAYATETERVGLLRSVVVDRDARGRGLGRRLVLDRIRWAVEAGYARLFLLTRDTQRFFAALGFEEVAPSALPAPVRTSAEFAAPCARNAAAMSLALDERVRRSAVRFTAPKPLALVV
jgi:amino-acid N-acetyltransferase